MSRGRKREAAKWFRAMCREQAPVRAAYAGFMAIGIEVGVPHVEASRLAYSFVGMAGLTIEEATALMLEEGRKWASSV